MEEQTPGAPEKVDATPKWDYTSSSQTFFMGAVVLGLNVLVIVVAVLFFTVPSVHAFLTGKPG